jgi:subtilisin family serine protease
MSADAYPDELRLGLAPDDITVRPRGRQLYILFQDYTPTETIERVISEWNLQFPARGDADIAYPQGRAQRWMEVPREQSLRETARGLLDHSHVRLASPVYRQEKRPGNLDAVAPKPGEMIVSFRHHALGGRHANVVRYLRRRGYWQDHESSRLLHPLVHFRVRAGSDGDAGFEVLEGLIDRRDFVEDIEWAELNWMQLIPECSVAHPAAVCQEEPWSRAAILLDEAHEKAGTGSTETLIGIIDGGFDLGHPAIASAFSGARLHRHFSSAGVSNDAGITSLDRTTGHATAVTGIIAANGGGRVGIAPGCSVVPIKLRFDESDGVSAGKAFRYAAEAKLHVINISLTLAVTNTLSVCVLDAHSAGCLICAPAGNGIPSLGDVGVSYPARMAEVIAVGAADTNMMRKQPTSPDNENWFSRYGNPGQVWAPGVHIQTADARAGLGFNEGGPHRHWEYCGFDYRGNALGDCAGDFICVFPGTSAATAHVSGLAALLRSCNPTLSADQLRAVIETTSRVRPGPPRTDCRLIDCSAAVDAVWPSPPAFPGAPTTTAVRHHPD